jgi:LacI family transcriptional regulator
MVTLKDIALACNFSLSTVSRAFNSGSINQEKKEIILQKAKDLGYIANNNAQILRNGKSNTIGIIVSDIKNYFYTLVLEKLVLGLKEVGYKTLISFSYENNQIEEENIKMLISSKVDAIIFTPVSNKNIECINIAKKQNIPILQLYRTAYKDINSIVIDDSYGSYLATKDFLKQGKKRILLLSVQVEFTPRRSLGYIKAFEELNVPVNDNLIIKMPLGLSCKQKIKETILSIKPDAIIAGTNNFGSDVLSILNAESEKINHPIDLVVFDDMEWLSILKISTIAQPIDEIYKTTLNKILKQLNNNTVTEEIIIKPKLIKRISIK